ncbi:threonine-phosphate decarboxylase CobD [Massilia sp. S19_KUP03_FR1]|uniref:threonine-phosphate decarboxylase CobD n=1 Tax=Massilia sp. S19_KUP03_FR1 TaxID=3025503 RepID=UPI002FCDB7B9
MLEHGGNLRAAARAFGRPVDDWLDLSAGLNPHWYRAPPLSANAWHRLPEVDDALLHAARAFYGAPQLLAVPGTQAAIQALPQLRAPSRVVVAAPSYAEHAHHWGRHGHSLREVAYADLEAAVDTCDVLVVCNPNNPTGALVPAATLLDWHARLAARGGWLVVDEAFADMAPLDTVAAHTGQPGLIVLRSVGKFFGLAGVRVGFVGAHALLLAALADALGPWTVSGPAQQVARAALEDVEWHAATRARLAQQGARLRALLAAHGIASSGTDLFQWWPEPHATALHAHMAERGIWVRLFTNAAHGIRLGLPPDDTAWRRLAQALTEWTRTT